MSNDKNLQQQASALSEKVSLSDTQSSELAENGTKPLRIATTLNPEYITLFIANDLGYFNQTGVPVELVVNDNYSFSEMTYLNGKADAIIEPLSDSIFRNSHTNSGSFFSIVVFVNDYSETADVILSEIKDLEFLKGQVIGADLSKSYSKTFLSQALERAGLTAKDFKLVSALPAQLVTGLKNGSIAAAHIWGPTKSQLIEEGFHVLFSANEIPVIVADVLVFKSRVINERPNDIQSIVDALDKSSKFVDSNLTEAAKIFNKNYNFGEAETIQRLDEIQLLNMTENQLAMKPSNQTTSLHTSVRIIALTLLQNGEVKSIVEPPRMIAARFINNVS